MYMTAFLTFRSLLTWFVSSLLGSKNGRKIWLNLWNVKIYVHIKSLLQSFFMIMALTHNCLLLSSPESLAKLIIFLF